MVKLGGGKHKNMEECYFCLKGQVKKRKVNIARYWGKELIVLNNVPALVCKQCGEKYFEAKVSHKIDQKIQEVLKNKAKQENINVPVAYFDA